MSFSDFVNGNPQEDLIDEKGKAAFESFIVNGPSVDFLPGDQLAANKETLDMARKNVENRVRDLGACISEWNGTVATIRLNGHVLDHVEMHGAVVDRKTGCVGAVRVDLSALSQRNIKQK